MRPRRDLWLALGVTSACVLLGVGTVGATTISAAAGTAAPSTTTGSTASLDANAWTVYHGDPAGSGVTTSPAPIVTSSPAWTSPSLNGQLYGEPLVWSGRRLRGDRERHGLRPVGLDGRGRVVDPPGYPGPLRFAALWRHYAHGGYHRHPRHRSVEEQIFVVADELVTGVRTHVLVGLAHDNRRDRADPATSIHLVRLPRPCCNAPG